MQLTKLLSITFLAVCWPAGSIAFAQPAQNEVLLWDSIAATASLRAGLPAGQPNVEARLYALTSIAVYDALNSIDRRNRPYVYFEFSSDHASRRAAVASAAHRVLVEQFALLETIQGTPSQHDYLEQSYADALAALPDNQRKRDGIFTGESAAAAILALRANDGWQNLSFPDFAYPQSGKPGDYQFTPGTPFAFAPNWGALPPFVLRDSKQFFPPPPYELKSRRYAADLNEIKALGGDNVMTPSNRTPYQTQTARFWLESSPPMWNRIARDAATRDRLDLWESARLFALLNIGLADGYIACFEAKYYYHFWRPITAIRNAENDENPLTVGDPSWTPLEPTPPIPDHDSGHATEGGVGARILERFFGRDRFRFSTCSGSLPDGQGCGEPNEVVREYRAFSDAASENGESRILVGFHFRHAVETGIRHGTQIADWVYDHTAQPVRSQH